MMLTAKSQSIRIVTCLSSAHDPGQLSPSNQHVTRRITAIYHVTVHCHTEAVHRSRTRYLRTEVQKYFRTFRMEQYTATPGTVHGQSRKGIRLVTRPFRSWSPRSWLKHTRTSPGPPARGRRSLYSSSALETSVLAGNTKREMLALDALTASRSLSDGSRSLRAFDRVPSF